MYVVRLNLAVSLQTEEERAKALGEKLESLHLGLIDSRCNKIFVELDPLSEKLHYLDSIISELAATTECDIKEKGKNVFLLLRWFSFTGSHNGWSMFFKV